MNAVKAEREKRGWSQVTQCMKTGGISPSDLSNGRKFPHPGWRKRIAKALGVDAELLFGKKDETESPQHERD